MNEVTRIHLGRTTYEIDVEAKKELEKYIAAIKRSLGDAEIMDDIESRMTEILADRGVNKDGVITSGDVVAIRAQLGEPRDFADEETEESEDWRDNLFTRGKDDSYRNRKFYRDEDNAMLGGVAAGLAAYTGWDLTLIRVAFVIAGLLSIGWAVLAYIIIWIVAPAARTASEKLAMRGEPVTLDSLKNSEFYQKGEENARAFAADVKEKVADVKSKAKTRKTGAKTYVAETKADVQDSVQAELDEAKAEVKVAQEIAREYRADQQSAGRVSPIAAIIGVILHCIGFAILISTFIWATLAIVVLLQHPFSHELWLWLALGASVIASFTLAGCFITAGGALMYRAKRRYAAGAIAGTLSGTIMMGFLSALFMGIWFYQIPENYRLPSGFVNDASKVIHRDHDICAIEVNWHHYKAITCKDLED